MRIFCLMILFLACCSNTDSYVSANVGVPAQEHVVDIVDNISKPDVIVELAPDVTPTGGNVYGPFPDVHIFFVDAEPPEDTNVTPVPFKDVMGTTSPPIDIKKPDTGWNK